VRAIYARPMRNGSWTRAAAHLFLGSAAQASQEVRASEIKLSKALKKFLFSKFQVVFRVNNYYSLANKGNIEKV